MNELKGFEPVATVKNGKVHWHNGCPGYGTKLYIVDQLAAVVQQRDELLVALDVLRDRVIDEYDRIYISGVIGKVQP